VFGNSHLLVTSCADGPISLLTCYSSHISRQATFLADFDLQHV